MTPRRILCSIDFSPGSEHAHRIAIRLAHQANIPLALVHARSGPPADRILELAEPSDLIVMGTYGRTGLSRVLLGSVAETVVRHAHCSVLVARRIAESLSFHHILVPVDFSDCSRRALDEAGELASRSRASVTLLHVIEMPDARGPDVELESTRQLDDWGDLVEARTATEVTRILRTGNPAPQVLSTADEDPSVDLIVVGSHGRTGLERMLIGSVAANVLRHATRPVMVAR